MLQHMSRDNTTFFQSIFLPARVKAELPKAQDVFNHTSLITSLGFAFLRSPPV